MRIVKKYKRKQFLLKIVIKQMKNFHDRGLWIRNPDPDPVCPERLDPDLDPVNIRPDPKPWTPVA